MSSLQNPVENTNPSPEPVLEDKPHTFFESWAEWCSTHPLRPVPALTWKLFTTLLSTGPFWIFLFIRFLTYIWLLMPAWLRLAWYYLTAREIRLNIKYGNYPRNYLDIFLPDVVLSGRKCPVVVFVTGGVWMIGYKAWGTLLGKLLIRVNVITVSVDYRNFPQGNIPEIVSDVDNSIDWVFRNIWKYGGDSTQIYIVGQSAGSHLGAYNYLRKIFEEIHPDPSCIQHIPRSLTNWKASDVKAFIGVSGPYDLPNLEDAFHEKGLHRALLYKIFNGHSGLVQYSPSTLLKHPSFQVSEPFSQKYRFYICHGGDDNSISSSSSEEFHNLLEEKGLTSTLAIYPGKSHTSPIIEDFMAENLEDATFYHDLLRLICAHSDHRPDLHLEHPYHDKNHESPKEMDLLDNRPCLVSPTLISLSRKVCPF